MKSETRLHPRVRNNDCWKACIDAQKAKEGGFLTVEAGDGTLDVSEMVDVEFSPMIRDVAGDISMSGERIYFVDVETAFEFPLTSVDARLFFDAFVNCWNTSLTFDGKHELWRLSDIVDGTIEVGQFHSEEPLAEMSIEWRHAEVRH